jgi:hypothetical protein
MGFAAAIRSRPLPFLFGLAAISLAALAFVPPIPQSHAYHQFADQRTLFGIPNFWDVMSNLPFVLVGAAGMRIVRGDRAAFVFFFGVFLTGFGSAWYHWRPDDIGLFWDRLPMTIAFMAILSHAIGERIDARIGALMLWPLVVLGMASLLVWLRYDDLRLYGWVQFFPLVALPILFLMFPPKFTGTGYWFAAAGLYGLAKVLEYADRAIYSAGHLLSGHTLKHLAAAGACYVLLRAFQTRRPLPPI